MVSRRVKVKPNRAVQAEFERVRFQLTGLYNWAVLKLFHDARGGIFYSRFELQALIRGHGAKCGLNQKTMEEVVTRAHRAHQRRGNRSRPAHLRGSHNKLAAVPFRGYGGRLHWADRTHIKLPGIGLVRVRPDPTFPSGEIKYGLLSHNARGWYLTLIIDADPKPIPAPPVDAPAAGVDFGFMTLVALSTGEKIPHPLEYQRLQRRLGQASRGRNFARLGRIHQSIANARRVRNHQVSRSLLSRHTVLYLSRDNYRGLQRTFGKSVGSAGIYQLISMLHTKGRPGGCRVVEVSNRNSTRSCHACGSLSGPAGKPGLSVRMWTCGACGAHHDRDINAAMNALASGVMLTHEIVREH
jgi:putative transposase